VEGMLNKSEGSYISAMRDAQSEETFARAVSSFYYACFQSVVAFMLLRGETVSKHRFVRSFVNQELVLKKLLSNELGKFYNELMDCRSDADYSPTVVFSRAQVDALAGSAEKFIRTMRAIIEREQGSIR